MDEEYMQSFVSLQFYFLGSVQPWLYASMVKAAAAGRMLCFGKGC